MAKTHYASIGEVSSGTLRDEDLLSSFAWALRYFNVRKTREQRKRDTELLRLVDELLDDNQEFEADDTTSDIVNELQDALSDIAPPHSYFGTLDGDGACFGFWPIVDNDELPRLSDPSECGQHRGEEVYIISDHGNVTCGYVDHRGKFHEFWAVV